jgi:hypothetical protein
MIDPIFAAIERYRIAEKALWDASLRADEVEARREGRTVSEAERRAVEVAGSEFDAAEGNFVSTIPTTIPGIAAKLHQIAQLDDGAMTFPDVKEALALILRSPQLGRGPDEPAGLPRHHHLDHLGGDVAAVSTAAAPFL